MSIAAHTCKSTPAVWIVRLIVVLAVFALMYVAVSDWDRAGARSGPDAAAGHVAPTPSPVAILS